MSEETPSKKCATRVLAVVLNWNGLEFTRRCCESLVGQEYAGLDVIVVDNGSTEHTEAQLVDACPGATVISTGRNLGFAGGINAGINAAPGGLREFEYVWLLNNDTVCDPDALSRLVAKAESSSKFAVVGCGLREGGEGADGRISPAGKRLKGPLYIPRDPDDPKEVDYICGANMLIRSRALQDVGLLDVGYFFFFEDADWCFSAKAKGWEIGVADGVAVVHTGSATIGRMSYNLASYYRAGQVRFLRKHAAFPLFASVTAVAYRIAVDILKLNMSGVRGNIRGFFRGWTTPIA